MAEDKLVETSVTDEVRAKERLLLSPLHGLRPSYTDLSTIKGSSGLLRLAPCEICETNPCTCVGL